MNLRFFGPGGSLQASAQVLSSVEQTSIGRLLGGSDEIFAITSYEEHAYNTQTEIWLLPEHGEPRVLLETVGVHKAFSGQATGKPPGVVIARQTYDGVHAETKGTLDEFWAWDSQAKSLALRAK